MKGQQKVIDTLNKLLISEETAIMQYKFNGHWNEAYEYNKIAEMFFERAKDERKHYNKLISRILLLEGLPVIDTVDNPKRAVDIRTQFSNDLELEYKCVQDYNDAIHLLNIGGDDIQPDNETRRILDHIMKDENEHVKEIEAVLKKIDDMTTQGFLQSFPK